MLEQQPVAAVASPRDALDARVERNRHGAREALQQIAHAELELVVLVQNHLDVGPEATEVTLVRLRTVHPYGDGSQKIVDCPCTEPEGQRLMVAPFGELGKPG